MPNDRIEVGDIVNVHFDCFPSMMNLTVVYYPVGEGDCWHMKKPNGEPLNIQRFTFMEFVSSPDTKF